MSSRGAHCCEFAGLLHDMYLDYCFVLMILILFKVLSMVHAIKQEALAWDGEEVVRTTRDMPGVASTGYRVAAQKPGEQAHGGVANVLQQDRLRGSRSDGPDLRFFD